VAETLDIAISVAPPYASVSEADIEELEGVKHALEAELADVRVHIAVRATPAGSIGLLVSPDELLVKVVEGAAGAAGAYAMKRTLETVARWREARRNPTPIKVLDEEGREIGLEGQDQTPGDPEPQP
jgi:hypothetical protein